MSPIKAFISVVLLVAAVIIGIMIAQGLVDVGVEIVNWLMDTF
jgi:divalent metal cation (Fe/Co/Zn/Cd) transporter